MKEDRKFKLLISSIALLCMLSIGYTAIEEFILPDIEGYYKRKLYYEQVISKKGLSMHKAKYWKQINNSKNSSP